MKKKIFVSILVLSLSLLSFHPSQVVLGAERTVQLRVFECDWPYEFARVGLILGGVEGVWDVETDYEGSTVTITFDDEEVNVGKFIEVLEKNGYNVNHEPIFLE